MNDGKNAGDIRHQLVELFSELENRLEVVDVEWNGFQIWPIVRTRIALMLLSRTIRQTTFVDHVARIVKPVTRFTRERILPNPPVPTLPIEQCDVLVFGDEFRSEHSGPAPGQDRVTGMIARSLEERGHFIHYVSRGQSTQWSLETNRWRPSHCGPQFSVVMKKALREIEQKFHRAVDWHAISSSIELMFSQSVGIEGRLAQLRPKLVVLPCWYARESVPITLACRRLGIPIVEIQHGLIDEDHPCYSGFTQTPSRPYDAMCPAVWFWGDQIREQILASSPGLMNGVQSFVGGYPFQLWNLRQPRSQNLTSAQPKILVAMQAEGFFDKLIADAIGNSPKDWHWLVKFHPRTSQKTLESFRNHATEEVLERVSQGNELLHGKDVYRLFSEVNCVLTGWSTVALEARAFGLPVILVHENGRTAFAEFVDSGEMTVAVTCNEVIESIQMVLELGSDRSASSLASRYFASADSLHEAFARLTDLM